MKTKICSLLIILLFASAINAQSDKKNSGKDLFGSKTGSMNDLMGQVVKGINTSSFTAGKTGKNDILGMLKGVGATDYLKYASIAGTLAGSLKGSAFLPDWANQKDGILDKLNTAGSIADVAGGMSGLLGNLNPLSLSKKLKGNIGSINTALGILSMIK